MRRERPCWHGRRGACARCSGMHRTRVSALSATPPATLNTTPRKTTRRPWCRSSAAAVSRSGSGACELGSDGNHAVHWAHLERLRCFFETAGVFSCSQAPQFRVENPDQASILDHNRKSGNPGTRTSGLPWMILARFADHQYPGSLRQGVSTICNICR